MKYILRQTKEFGKWLQKIKDMTTKVKVLTRLDRIENGSFGDCKKVSKDIFELRFHFGPGYRIYYTIKKNVVVLLLVGGDKSTQKKDIKKAKSLLE